MCGLDPAICSVLAAKDAALKTQVSFAVEGKRLDAQRQAGDAVGQLLDAAAKLSKAVDRGHTFDAQA